MKKIKLFSALALTLALAACDDFDLPNPPGQTNTDPEAYFENSNLVMAPNSEAISLTAANEANQYVTVANITTFENFPEGYTLEVDMEVGNDGTFSKTTTLSTVIDGDAVTVNPDLLNGAIQSVITKKPGTYDVNSRLAAYAVRGNTRIRLGGVNNYYLTEALNVTTFDATKVIEDAYYLVPCALDGTPNMGAAIQMNNTAGSSVSAYDNPEFAIKIESPAPDGYFFKIAPQSAISAGSAASLYGANPAADGMSGKLSTDYGVGHISITGDVLITVNMEEDSYSVNYAFEVLYPFSGSTAADKLMLLYTTNYINYSGVAAINNQWFLGAKPDKKAEPLFRQSEEEEAVVSEDGLVMTGLLTNDPSAAQIKTPVRGNHLYWVDVNLVQLTYSLSAIETLSVIGSANGWSNEPENVVDLTPSKDLKIWTGTDIHVGPEFKLNANHAWEIDFGGTKVTDTEGEHVYNITMKGGNLEVEEGNYDITVDFSVQPYVLTLKKK
ncbi:MAG: hypothetical protein K2J48_10810 [Muribaculaceae bacterium]|nr:hypothetical protein [Muribaculaceae bacterium]